VTGPLPEYLLELPAEEAARLIALGLLDAVRAAEPRLARPDDSEALHDFRVALRRLRTTLRTYRPQLGAAARRGLRRRLGRLADATRQSRDLEVHLAWIRDQLPALTDRQRAGAEWLAGRMERRRRRADRRLARRVERTFEPTVSRLERRLRRWRARIELDPGRRRQAAAGVIAGRIGELAGDLETALAAVHSLRDLGAAHRARIVAKRLRYILEPVAGHAAGVEPVLEQLRGLQDALGDLHDSQVFVEELAGAVERASARQTRRLARALREWTPDPTAPDREDARPGLLALARLLRVRGTAAFEQLSGEWLDGRAEAFFHAVAELGRAIAARPAGPLEIERKYLLSAVPPGVVSTTPVEIEQGYLPGTRLVERLRRVAADGETTWYRTVKAGAGLSRIELEEETTGELFDDLWPFTEGRRLAKRRYRLPDGDHTWEVDQFLDRDLVLAEVELAGPEDAVPPPEWLAPYVVREVTGEPEFANAALAR
jgi:CHAD domain-containing protein/CYTH domain-containing protein